MKKLILCITTILLLAASAPCLGAEWEKGGDDWERGPVDVPEWPGFEKGQTPSQPEYEKYKHEGGPESTLDQFKMVDGELVKVVGETELPQWEYETEKPEMAEWDYETEGEPISNRPEPRITRITYNSEMIKGQTSYLGIGVTNLGTYSPDAKVILSHSDGIDIINTSGRPSVFTPGEEVKDSDRNPIKVKNTMLRWGSEFDVGEDKVFSLNYEVDGQGQQWFKVRLFFSGEGGRWAARQVYPTESQSDVTDQQGFPAVQLKVSVSEPQEPAAALNCLAQKTGDKINLNFSFKNVGDKTLRKPAFSFGGKTISGGWDLAPDSYKNIGFTINNFEKEFITREAKITGCYDPCSSNYISKQYRVDLYKTDGNVYCNVIKATEPTEDETRADRVSAHFKEMEDAQVIKKESGVVQIVFEQINNFFKMFLSR